MARLRDSEPTSLPVAQQPRNPQSEPIARSPYQTADYDDAFVTLRAEGNLDFRFVHGVPAAATRDGQAAATLADLVLRGLSQNGIRRLPALVRNQPGLFSTLPDDWTRILPREAPLSDEQAWFRLLDKIGPDAFSDGKDHRPTLREIVTPLSPGPKQ